MVRTMSRSWVGRSTARRLVLVFAVVVTLLVSFAPAAQAWTVSECTFTGSNSFYGGNTAQAVTYDSNGRCDDLWAKVHYKSDGVWYWSSAATNIPGYDFTVKVVNGADAADMGNHRATSDSGVLSYWKTSY